MSCVLDTSALLKGTETDERGSASLARRIRPHLAETFGLRAPWLAAWEVGNVIHTKRPSSFGSSRQERQELVDVILTGIELDAPSPFHRARTGRLSEDHGLTIYDAAYLELAEREDGVLVTEDHELLEAGRSELGVERSLTVPNAFHHIEDGVL